MQHRPPFPIPVHDAERGQAVARTLRLADEQCIMFVRRILAVLRELSARHTTRPDSRRPGHSLETDCPSRQRHPSGQPIPFWLARLRFSHP